jgi:hypothetical protein
MRSLYISAIAVFALFSQVAHAQMRFEPAVDFVRIVGHNPVEGWTEYGRCHVTIKFNESRFAFEFPEGPRGGYTRRANLIITGYAESACDLPEPCSCPTASATAIAVDSYGNEVAYISKEVKCPQSPNCPVQLNSGQSAH